MTIKLSIEITSPLTADDRDLLSGVAVMTLAIANRELQTEQSAPPPDPEPCGDLEIEGDEAKWEYTGRACVSDVGHKGRHKYRVIPGFMAPEGLN